MQPQPKPIVTVTDTTKKVEGTNLFDICVISEDNSKKRLALLNNTANITSTTTFDDIIDTPDLTVVSQLLIELYRPDRQSLVIHFGYDVTQ